MIKDKFDLYIKCSSFLYNEALLLDSNKFDEWLELLAEDLEYAIPIRITQGESVEDEVTNENFIMKAGKEYFKVLAKRLKHQYGWASKEHSRTRRHVSNILIKNIYTSNNSLYVELTNNLLLIRTEKDEYHYSILSALRKDALKVLENRVLLAKRYVILDHSNIPMHNLYFPL
jgi:ethylbenzene dioxygenase beta subunit